MKLFSWNETLKIDWKVYQHKSMGAKVSVFQPWRDKTFSLHFPQQFYKKFRAWVSRVFGTLVLKKKTFFHELTFTLLNRKVLYEALKVDKSTQFCSCKWHWSKKKHFNCNVSDTFRELNVTDDTIQKLGIMLLLSTLRYYWLRKLNSLVCSLFSSVLLICERTDDGGL